jgi:hypothetical protein
LLPVLGGNYRKSITRKLQSDDEKITKALLSREGRIGKDSLQGTGKHQERP